jgi:hypothetical protein
MRSCVVLERIALDVVEDLGDVGVATRLLKGPAVAHLDYPDPAWRSFGDVDLLVRSDDYDRAVAILVAGGSFRRSDEVRRGFDRRFGKGVCLIRPDGVQIDLHRTLASGPFGLTVDTEELFAANASFDLGGRRVEVLDEDLRFVHACFHAVLGDFPPRLTALRDVAQMLTTGRVDLDRVQAIAVRWRAGVVLATAVASAWTVLRLPRDPALEWAFRYVPTRFERSSLGAYVGARRSYARQMIAAVPALPGIGARLRYVVSLLFAERSYLARREGNYLRRVATGVRAGTTPRKPT